MSPMRPLFNAPTIDMAPTQYNRLAVTKPSAIVDVSPSEPNRLIFSCTQFPTRFIALSRSSSSPINPPMTMDKIMIRLFCPFSEPLIPMQVVHSASPCMMMLCSRSPSWPLPAENRAENRRMPHRRSSPTVEPAKIAATLTMEPISILSRPSFPFILRQILRFEKCQVKIGI